VAALDSIGHLPRNDRIDLRTAHPSTPPYPVDLDGARRRNDDHEIDAPLPAGLQQQRNVQDRRALPGRPGAGEEPPLFCAHHRMDDPLYPLQRFRLAEDQRAQRRAIQREAALRVRMHSTWKRGGNRRQRLPARRLQSVNGGVGIEHWEACAPECGRDRRFAHADPAGQTDHSHSARLSFNVMEVKHRSRTSEDTSRRHVGITTHGGGVRPAA
jgi:hypothetical protein